MWQNAHGVSIWTLATVIKCEGLTIDLEITFFVSNQNLQDQFNVFCRYYHFSFRNSVVTRMFGL